MITVLSFIFVLGVLVFVHELGHFLAAKRVGIRVLKFQLGFNPTIFSIRRGETEYGIGALPLGGFVKMAGESPEEPRSGRSDEFLSKSKWERFQVLVMGPVMNIALALGISILILFHGAEVPVYEDQAPVVAFVTAGSAGEKAGIKPGDRILEVAERKVDTWEQFLVAVGARPKRETPLKILRDGSTTTLNVTPAVDPADTRFEVGDVGVLPNVHPHLLTIEPNEPGERGGLKSGDVILAVDGQPVAFSYQLRDAIAKHPEQQIVIVVKRGGEELKLPVTPMRMGQIGHLGVGISDETRTFQPGPREAVVMAVKKNVEYAQLIFQTLGGLFTRETSPRQLMGPLAIAQLSGESAQLGWIALFSLMASLSLNLGLLNLMPIPVLDGGHIFIMLLEGVARRDFSLRVKENMLLAGFVVLMMLMVTVIYNDLTRITWISRLIPWM
ncbi:MAG TPA: RIP metalloprotease RseP [Vicinamibacterales bacterium]|nr:RIP metalloprotease RseP [Vicinamibacterales bacterium]